MEPPSRSTGRWIADALAGSWRRDPPGAPLAESIWNAIGPPLIRSGAGALAWRQIRRSPLAGSTIGQRLKEIFRFQRLQTGVYERELERALGRLRQAGIEPIVIKGWATAQAYPERGARPLGDLDLVVHPGLLGAAQSVIHETGPYAILIDWVHLEIDGLDRRRFEDLYERSSLRPLGSVEVRVLSAEDHLRALCLHLLKHGAYRPLWLCDIAAALEHRPSKFDWDRCFGNDGKRARWVGSVIRLAHELLGARIESIPSERRWSAPRWLGREVLRQWDDPAPKSRWTPELFARAWSRPHRLPAALRARWWDPIRSTLHLRGAIDARPRLPYQLASFLLRGTQYLSRR